MNKHFVTSPHEFVDYFRDAGGAFDSGRMQIPWLLMHPDSRTPSATFYVGEVLPLSFYLLSPSALAIMSEWITVIGYGDR